MMVNQHNRKPWFMLTMVYMTQYIGISFILTTSVVVLKLLGISLTQLALLNLVVLPIAGKLFFALIVDHVKTIFNGQYRGWLLIAQVGMVLLLFIISFVDIREEFYFVLGLFLVYSTMTCIQDVAVDGLACKIFSENERQKANTIQYSGNLLGNILGGGIVLIFYDSLQWNGALLLLSGLTLFSFIQLLLYRNESLEDKGSVGEIKSYSCYELFIQIKAFMQLHKRWFLVLVILPSGFSSAYALINPMLVDIGWSMADIGMVTKIYGSILGMFSALSIIPLINKFGRLNTILLLLLLQGCVLFAFPLLMIGDVSAIAVYFAMGSYSLIQPALLAAISTLIMDNAASMRAKSTFFSLQLSVVVLMGFVYSAVAMLLAGKYGYSDVIFGCIILNFIVGYVFYMLVVKD